MEFTVWEEANQQALGRAGMQQQTRGGLPHASLGDAPSPGDRSAPGPEVRTAPMSDSEGHSTDFASFGPIDSLSLGEPHADEVFTDEWADPATVDADAFWGGLDSLDSVTPGLNHAEIGDADAPYAAGANMRSHKRELSEAFTMRYPLVSPIAQSGESPYGSLAGSQSYQPPYGEMRTPIRGPSSLETRFGESPSYLGLESPLDSPALQSPYNSYHPFPAVPGSVTSSLPRKKQTAASPRPRRASSTASAGVAPEPVTPAASRKYARNASESTPTQASLSSTKDGDELTPTQGTPASLSDEKKLNTNNQLAPTQSDSASSRAAYAAATESGNTTPTQGTPGPAGASITPKTKVTPGKEGKRDSRKRIGKEQIEVLETFFHVNPRPEREDRLRLAAETKLEQRTVQIWFQNRRAKARAMKMPPSEADTSAFAMQYRAAAAAASNAAAAAAGSSRGSHPPLTPSRGSLLAPSSTISDKQAMEMWEAMGQQHQQQQHQQQMNVSLGHPSLSRSHSYGAVPVIRNSMTPGGSASLASMTSGGSGGSSSSGGSAGSSHGTTSTSPMAYQFARWQGPHGSHGSPQQSLARYHQQLGKHGMPPQAQAQHQMQQMQQMHHLQAQQMQRMQQQHYNQMQMQMQGHRRTPSGSYEPYMRQQHPSMDQDIDLQPYGVSPPMSSHFGVGSVPLDRSGSTVSLMSMNSPHAVPHSPLQEAHTLTPDLRSIQNSPEMHSPTLDGSIPPHGRPRSAVFSQLPPLERSQSAVMLHTSNDWAPTSEMKRRRSLFGPVPNWGWPGGEPGAPAPDPASIGMAPQGAAPSATSPTAMPPTAAAHGSGRRSSYSSHGTHGLPGSLGSHGGPYPSGHAHSGSMGSLAASAAAAALRTRNRSYTQPSSRSRQPSVRLQLDESNHSAQLVILPQNEDGSPSRSSSRQSRGSGGSNGSVGSAGSSGATAGRSSPDRAERAAERLLAERAAGSMSLQHTNNVKKN